MDACYQHSFVECSNLYVADTDFVHNRMTSLRVACRFFASDQVDPLLKVRFQRLNNKNCGNFI